MVQECYTLTKNATLLSPPVTLKKSSRSPKAYQLLCLTLWYIHDNLATTMQDRTRTCVTIAYAQILHFQCDLDLQTSDMGFCTRHNIFYDSRLCQIRLESHHARQSFGPDKF